MRDASLAVVSSSNDSRDTLSGSDDNYYEYDYSSAGECSEIYGKSILSSDDDEQLKAISWFQRYMSISEKLTHVLHCRF
ncbi:hypothetical protein WN944_024098 [Citrus x changshan-huyou]|uniref:Uncharacterized protein n=1 Tax=Citrus x changshan-huyou TaxID=2935761 RepID=A0AAP0LMW0_9ROSI